MIEESEVYCISIFGVLIHGFRSRFVIGYLNKVVWSKKEQ